MSYISDNAIFQIQIGIELFHWGKRHFRIWYRKARVAGKKAAAREINRFYGLRTGITPGQIDSCIYTPDHPKTFQYQSSRLRLICDNQFKKQ